MIEMTSTEKGQGDALTAAPSTTEAAPADELTEEYAVGTGVPRGWDEEDPQGACEDCGGEDGPCVRAARSAAARCCRALGARRLGHMAVLRLSRLPADGRVRPGGARAQTRLDCVVGPFWPFTACVTYPLILLVSGAVATSALPGCATATRVAWGAAVAALLVALSCVACRDPGVLRRRPRGRDRFLPASDFVAQAAIPRSRRPRGAGTTRRGRIGRPALCTTKIWASWWPASTTSVPGLARASARRTWPPFTPSSRSSVSVSFWTFWS